MSSNGLRPLLGRAFGQSLSPALECRKGKGSPGPHSLQASLGLFSVEPLPQPPPGLFALPLADHPAELHLTSWKYWHKSCQEIAAQIKCPLQLDFQQLWQESCYVIDNWEAGQAQVSIDCFSMHCSLQAQGPLLVGRGQGSSREAHAIREVAWHSGAPGFPS